MRLFSRTHPSCRAAAGHSLPEAVIAVSLVGVMFLSLYAGSAAGFGIPRSARGNIRATEILNEQTERIRLLNWRQVLSADGYLPSQFVQPFYPTADSANPEGPLFYGKIETGIPADWPEAY